MRSLRIAFVCLEITYNLLFIQSRGKMLWVHDYKTGRGRGLQVVVQGLGPVLAMLEQLQGLSRILVHHRLLHGTPEMQYLDYPKD